MYRLNVKLIYYKLFICNKIYYREIFVTILKFLIILSLFYVSYRLKKIIKNIKYVICNKIIHYFENYL